MRPFPNPACFALVPEKFETLIGLWVWSKPCCILVLNTFKNRTILKRLIFSGGNEGNISGGIIVWSSNNPRNRSIGRRIGRHSCILTVNTEDGWKNGEKMVENGAFVRKIHQKEKSHCQYSFFILFLELAGWSLTLYLIKNQSIDGVLFFLIKNQIMGTRGEGENRKQY